MKRPTVSLSASWQFPEPQIFTLAGGMKVWAFDLPGQHIAALEVVLPTSLAAEPRSIEGVATVALHSADEGTVSNPDGRISELLELQGAALHGQASQHSTRLGGDAPAHRLPEVITLLTEVIREPAFAPADIEHHVEMQVAAFDSRVASPGWVAKQALRQVLFGDEAREGRPGAGTPETLQHIGRDDVLAWHAAHWSGGDATLVLAGDFMDVNLASALAPMESWSGTTVASGVTVAEPRAAQLVLVDMPDAVQATIHAGSLTVGRRHPDWAALKLAGHAMCGAFASRLNLELREQQGYTYGVGGGFTARQDDGQFFVGGSFRVEVAADALRRLLAGLELAEPFTTAEIEDAKRYLVGVAPLANETASDIARQAAVLAAVGEHPAFVNEHFAALEIPTASQVSEAFQRHIQRDSVSVAISGPASTLVPALQAAGLDPVVVS
ncbi:MAG: pitrilysin family protein [Propionibacteriaceae bacterium]|nr:pitrilysin family protein [Propionibacteriaceae bacterium]